MPSRSERGPATRRSPFGSASTRSLVLGPLILATLLLGAGGGPGPLGQPVAEAAAGCRIYVAAGDDIPAGHDLNDDFKRYPEKLLEDHLKSPGWCVYNQGKNGQTSSDFITGGG